MTEKTIKTPPPDDAERCINLRVKSKKGRDPFVLGEHAFCQRIYKAYPEWYDATEGQVWDASLPFGSNVTWEKLHGGD